MVEEINIPEGYKSTELGIIPKEWLTQKLYEIADIIMGQSPLGSSYNQIGKGVALINGPTEFTDRYPIKIQWTTSPTKLCNSNDILLCIRGSSTGRINISNNDYCIGRGVTAIRAKANSTNTFLEFQVHNVVKRILKLSVGSTFPNLDSKSLKNIDIALPPLSEQKAIAQSLSDVDALIGECDRIITKKRNTKQGTMQQLLPGKKRLPGFSGEWEMKKLGEILKVRHGKSQHDVVDQNGEFPILATGGEIGRAKTYLYNKPSVLIGRKGTIDIPQYMDIPFWTIDTLFYTEILTNAFPKFIFYRFNLIDWYSYNEASGVPSLNAKTIENIEVYLPSIQEQKAITQILSDMDAEIAALEQKRDKYKVIKQGMMQELLTGKTRLNRDYED